MNFDKYKHADVFYWERIKGANLVGRYELPELVAVHDVEPHDFVPFHMAKTVKDPTNRWYHFYEDDYQFERIWNRPAQYISLLKKFEGGISTDFSMYLDMPKGQQIWNCYRNRVMAYYMQREGLVVVPNVGWSDEESLNWAFDGIPENSVLSVTTQGCMGRDYYSKQSLLNGLHELARQKHPEKLIVYGRFPEVWLERFPMPIVVLKTFAAEKWGA